jgi:hypothetical protein
MAEPNHSVLLEGDMAAVRRVANPLGVGLAAETRYTLGDDRFVPWGTHFERELGRRGNEQAPVTVGEIRGWITAMAPPNGLRDEVKDLIVLAWAALRRRAWFSYGAPIPTPAPGWLRPEMEMRVQPMPDPGQWTAAATRAGHLFGLAAGPYLTPQAVAQLAENIKQAIRECFDAIQSLVPALERAYEKVDADATTPAERLATARVVARLTQQLRQLDGVELVRRLADADVENETATGGSIASAGAVGAALNSFRWDRLEPLREAAAGEGPRADSAAQILASLRRQLEANEIVTSAAAALRQTEDGVFAWLTGQVPATPRPRRRGDSSRVDQGCRTLKARESTDDVVAELRHFRKQHLDNAIVVEWRAE